MEIAKLRRDRNFCPACTTLGKQLENIYGIRKCPNESCKVDTFSIESMDYSQRELYVQDMPECPSCHVRAKLDKYNNFRCPNPKCKVDKLGEDTYIKIREQQLDRGGEN